MISAKQENKAESGDKEVQEQQGDQGSPLVNGVEQ